MPKRQSGGIEYTLIHKAVKNMNLRIQSDGSVTLSVPKRVTCKQADDFIAQKSAWILQAKARQSLRARRQQEDAQQLWSDAACLQVLGEISDKLYPAFAHVLPRKPQICVRAMKTRWGTCMPARGKITISKYLLLRPRAAVEYVMLHEYIHFIHPDHQQGFYRLLAQMMPDYAQRKALLYSE